MFSGKSLSLKSSAGSITKPTFELLRVGEVEPVAMIILFVSNSLLSTRIEFADTICGATYERQRAVEKLAKKVDVLLIVGGYNSSNTKKLYNIGKEINENSYLIETKEDLKAEWLLNKEKIGITAGASTPEKSIIEIENFIREEIWHGKF